MRIKDPPKLELPEQNRRQLGNAILALLAALMLIGLSLAAQTIGHYLGIDSPVAPPTLPATAVSPFAIQGYYPNSPDPYPTLNGLSVHGILLDQVVRVTIDGMELYILAAPAP